MFGSPIPIAFQVARVKPSKALVLHRDEIRRLVLHSRARNPRVFGSVLHGRDTERSDLDILVDPLPGTTLFDLGGLQVALQELLGVPVDLLTPGDLPRRSRDLSICAECREEYEALLQALKAMDG